MNLDMNFLYRSRNTANGPLAHARRSDLAECRLFTRAALLGDCKKSRNPSRRAWQLLRRVVVRIPNIRAFLAVAALFAAFPSCVLAADSSNSVPDMAGSAAYGGEIPTNGMGVLDDQYKLAPGDTINYQVLEDGDNPQVITVTDSGDIEVPYLGRYPAADKTCKELAWDLKAALQKKYYYQATVIISVNSMISHGVIYIEGAVKTPGPLEMPRDEDLTISKAILHAGGFDDFADGKHVRVTRKAENGTNEVLVVNVSSILNKDHTERDVPARPGDMIFVPEKTFRW